MYTYRASSLLSIVLVSLFVLGGCEYQEHFARQRLLSSIPPIASYDTIPYLTGVEMWILPDKEKILTLGNAFSAAKKRIWIEIYTWTEKSTIEAVLSAKKRGVDVRVILEGNVFGAPEINREVFEKLKSVNIPVVYASNDNFTFTHAKFWIIDDTYFISTGNLSYTSFTKNRDIIMFGHHASILSDLVRIFEMDFNHTPFLFETSSGLLISPLTMRSGIETALQNATESIGIYVQSLSDKNLINIIKEKSRDGVMVSICIADKGKSDTSDETLMEALSGTNIIIKTIKKPYPHLKLINLDDTILFVGSTNFTKNALENNREVALLFYFDDAIRSALRRIDQSECLLYRK